MLLNRLIPVLLLSNNGLVKTCRLSNPSYVGDPINVIKIFNKKEVDELIILDILASKKNLNPNYELIEKIAGECFMPLTYGGGIRNLKQAKKVFSLGVEKICLQSSAVNNPKLITEISDVFGSQSIVISLDIKKNIFGKPGVYNSSLKKRIRLNYKDQLIKYVKCGAGEILLHSVDREGTLSGPDLDLIKNTANLIDIPLIYLGGISNLSEIKDSLDSGADAVAAGSYFVFKGPHKAVLISYPKQEDLNKFLYNK